MSNLFKLVQPHPQIYCFLFPKDTMAAETFAAMAEHYEGGLTKGMALTRAQIKDIYSLANGGWTYPEDWAGFNLPGHAVAAFRTLRNLQSAEIYGPERLVLEALKDALKAWDAERKPFYVIGCGEDDLQTLRHEMAHAFWGIDPEVGDTTYKTYMAANVEYLKNSPFTSEAIAWNIKQLKDMGYNDSVIDDEVHAYTADNDGLWMDCMPEWLRYVVFPRRFSGHIRLWTNRLAGWFRFGAAAYRDLRRIEREVVAFTDQAFEQWVKDPEFLQKLKDGAHP